MNANAMDWHIVCECPDPDMLSGKLRNSARESAEIRCHAMMASEHRDFASESVGTLQRLVAIRPEAYAFSLGKDPGER